MLLNTGNSKKKYASETEYHCVKNTLWKMITTSIFSTLIKIVFIHHYHIEYINIYFQNDSNTITLFTRFHVNWSTVYKKTWLNLNEFSFFMKITCVTCGWLNVLKIIFVKIAACFFLIFDYLWLIVNV